MNARDKKTIQVECEVADMPPKNLRSDDSFMFKKVLEDIDKRSEDVDVDFVECGKKQEEIQEEIQVKDLYSTQDGKMRHEMRGAHDHGKMKQDLPNPRCLTL